MQQATINKMNSNNNADTCISKEIHTKASREMKLAEI